MAKAPPPVFLHPSMQAANAIAASKRAAQTADIKAGATRQVWALQASAMPTATPVVRAHTLIVDPHSPITRR